MTFYEKGSDEKLTGESLLGEGERECFIKTPACHDPCAPKTSKTAISVYVGLNGKATFGKMCPRGTESIIGSAFFIFLGILTIGFVTMMASTLTSMTADPVVGWFIYAVVYGSIIGAVVGSSTRVSVSLFQSLDTLLFIFFGKISFCNGVLTLFAQTLGWALCPILYLCFFDMNINNFTVPGPGIVQTMSPIIVTPIIPVGCNAVFAAQYVLLTVNAFFSFFAATGSKHTPIVIGALYGSTAFIFVAFSGAPGDFWRWFFVACYQQSFECCISYIFSLIAAFATVLFLISAVCKVKKIWSAICEHGHKSVDRSC